jgi:hypothetical protein
MEAFELLGMLGGFPLADALGFDAPAFAMAQMIEAGVGGDAEKPAFEARFTAIAANIFEDADENVLQKIFGILPLRDHAIDVAKERLAPGFDERAEGSAVTLLRALDELQFFFW